MSWLRRVTPKDSSIVTNRGEYKSGRKMSDPDKVTKIDFLPSGILKEIIKNGETQ